VSDGFGTLWESGRLEMSCEAYVLLPWYGDLFTDEQVAVASFHTASTSTPSLNERWPVRLHGGAECQ
jgi:hypothetical protein